MQQADEQHRPADTHETLEQEPNWTAVFILLVAMMLAMIFIIWVWTTAYNMDSDSAHKAVQVQEQKLTLELADLVPQAAGHDRQLTQNAGLELHYCHADEEEAERRHVSVQLCPATLHLEHPQRLSIDATYRVTLDPNSLKQLRFPLKMDPLAVELHEITYVETYGTEPAGAWQN